ncbi:MAG: glycosyltransferase family 1 protein [Chloroflexi bacterium HGW-Chloroflexi-3]|nr:MAG: glycosyltransferase family 1 protein [Chloroflexi bacterium HGW-Chloroflexi-3]
MPNSKVLLVANTDWYLFNFRLSLAKFLRDKGFDVVFVSPDGEYRESIIQNGFQHILWHLNRRSTSIFFEAKALIELFRIYKIEKPDLVHHFTIKPVIYGSISSRLLSIKATVHSITGLGYIFLSNDWKGKLLRLFVFPIYKFSLSHQNNFIIFENSYDRDVFIKHKFVKIERTSIIQGVGVDEDYYGYSPDPNLEVPLVILPARMLFDKGINTLVEAAKILKAKVSVKIALIGDVDPGNPSSIDVSTIQNWESEGLVEWWGFQKDMRQVYQNCNIVTLPSLGEGLPTVLIEAAASGRAIVATDVAGCRDVVKDGENGFLVPPNNPNALADVILDLINDPAKRELMGKKGRSIAEEKFTTQIVNNKTLDVYKTLL